MHTFISLEFSVFEYCWIEYIMFKDC